jgi:MFS family permease
MAAAGAERTYGWLIVAIGLVVTCVGMGSMMSLAVFLEPMTAATGWSRTGVSTAATLNFLFMGVASFGWGALSDRFGTRPVVLTGALLLGAGMAAASQATSLLLFQILFGVVVGVAVGAFYAPLTAAASAWVTHHRTLAVALVSAGMGVGSLTVAPFARWMISAHDWRLAMLAVAALTWLAIIPAAMLVRRPPAGDPSAPPAPGAIEGPAMSVGQALRTPQFACIALTHFACCAAHSGPIFHMVTFAIGCGLPAMVATSVFGVAGLAGLGGRIFCGMIADRVGVKPTLVVGLAFQAIAISLYLVVSDLGSFYALSILFGLSYGGVMPLYAVLVRDYFGARIMGTTFGAVSMVASLGMALGPWAGGWAFDSFASYTWLYIGSLSVGVGAVAVALTFRPPASNPAVLRAAPAA